MDPFSAPAAQSARAALLKKLGNPLYFKAFLLRSLPAAMFSGVSLRSVTGEACTVVVPYSWRTRNPFRSTYFACLAMAAEMSTGVLAMLYIQGVQPRVALIITGMEASFHKKALADTFFTCNDGDKIRAAVAEAVATGNSVQVTVASEGFNKTGEPVARFNITWSFRARKS